MRRNGWSAGWVMSGRIASAMRPPWTSSMGGPDPSTSYSISMPLIWAVAIPCSFRSVNRVPGCVEDQGATSSVASLRVMERNNEQYTLNDRRPW
jgi:hypothetical protein